MAQQTALGFAGLLRQLRAGAKLTQEELAQAAGLSPRSVSDLERGVNRTARKDTAELLAGALGLAEPACAAFVAAARGRAPAADVLVAVRSAAGAAASDGPAASGDLVWSGCPYLGLVPFEERDARVFYGRGELADQLVRRLAERLDGTGMLLVAGESGAGKSSLLRAGLMPRLTAGALGPGSQEWPRRVIRPEDSPVRELAMVLAEVAGADPVSVYRSLLAAPDEAPMLVEQAVRTAAGRSADTGSGRLADAPACAPPRLVLVVDQFEELFTVGGGADAGRVEREAFIAALDAAATVPVGPHKRPAALVIAVVRADFLGRLIAYPPLKAALDAGPFTVGPMSEAEVRLAVTGPAAEAGLTVEPALVEAVIAELRERTGGGLGSGVLPLMSQAMAATWQCRESSELTLRGYRRAGGVADAVNRSAEVAYDALTSRQKDAARLVFTQLTVITPDGQFVRRRCTRTDLHSPGADTAADIDAVIDVFSAQRLLVLGQDSVEISHDVLLQAWKQLRDWLEDDQLDRALWSQVVTDADTWHGNRRDSSYLYRPGRLATIDAAATRWQDAPTRYPPLPATSKAFVAASHQAARRGTRRRRSGFAILAVLTALAVAASVVAFSQRAAAVRQRDQAIGNQVIAEALQSGASDTSLAAQLTLAAYRIQPTQDLASRLLNTENTPLSSPLATGAGGVYSVAFSPDGHTLASGNNDGTIRLWNVTDPADPRPLGQPLTGSGAPVGPVAFSPDGHTLASGDADGTVRLWNVTDPARPRPLGQPQTSDTSVDAVAFSPDGHTLASGDADGTVRLWNVTDPARPRPRGQPLTGDGTPVGSVAFSPDGHTLASGDADGTIRLWDITDHARPRPRGQPLTSDTSVDAVAFSPDGHTLASGDADGTIRLWNVTDPADPRPLGQPLTGSGAPVGPVAFSPDGHTLASGDGNGTIRLWNVTDPADPRPLGQPLTDGSAVGVNSVGFSPDGRTLASGDADGTIRLWSLPQTVLASGSAAVESAVGSVAFSPDGHVLASGDGEGTIRLWDVADPADSRPLGQPLTSGGSVYSVAFSPDGHTLASGDGNGTIRLWNVTDPADPRPLGQPLTGDGTPVGSVAFSPDGHTLASGDGGGTIRLWNVADPARPRPLGHSGAGVPITSVTFSPSGRTLAGGSNASDGSNGDATVLLWDVADPVYINLLSAAPTGSSAAVDSVAFSPDGHTLTGGDGDGTVWLWNVADPALPRPLGQPLTGSGAAVGSVAISAGGHTLASGDSDGTIRLWDITDPADPRSLGQPLTGDGTPVDSVAISADGHTLASGSNDGGVRLWNLNVQYAIDRICATAGGLTPQQWNEYIPQLRYQPLCVH
jgi:WD40 repeat protein/transcriptional regulator with XRE-family HTH domain